MAEMIRCEIKKAFLNRWFLVALIIGCTLVAISASRNYQVGFRSSDMMLQYMETKWLDASSISSYKYWVVVDFIQPLTGLFFQLLPLLAVIPFSWSYLEERRSGYVGSIITRTSRTHYFIAKYSAVFLSGALVITIPILLNFLICACLMPMRTPDVFAVIYFGIWEESLWSEVFYTRPMLYVALFTLLNFSFSGIWAASVFSLSALIKNRVALVVLPYLALVYIEFISKAYFFDLIQIELTPSGFLRGGGAGFPGNGYYIAVLSIVLLILSIAGTIACHRRDAL